MIESAPWLVLAAAAISAMTTYAVREFALGRQLLDLPNERSSHVRPTPRLGGLGVVAGLLPVAAILAHVHGAPARSFVVLAATAAISVVGLIDDVRPLPARVRFITQLAAGSAVLAAAGDDVVQQLGLFASPAPTWLVVPGLLLWMTWATNLFNFMDGIDGLAGGQAVVAGIAIAAAAFGLGAPLAGWMALALAASTAGFLVFNFPPASIFMGDVGSTALGFFIAALPFLGSDPTPVPVHVTALAIALFILDATWTLVRRLLAGERVFQAHRTHWYQRGAATTGSHLPVTLTAYAGMLVVGYGSVLALRTFWPSAALATATFLVLVFLVRSRERALGVRVGETAGQGWNEDQERA